MPARYRYDADKGKAVPVESDEERQEREEREWQEQKDREWELYLLEREKHLVSGPYL